MLIARLGKLNSVLVSQCKENPFLLKKFIPVAISYARFSFDLHIKSVSELLRAEYAKEAFFNS